MALDGTFIREMTLPLYHLLDPEATAEGPATGLRPDCGYQGMTITPNDDFLYVIAGCPLFQTAKILTPTEGAPVSMLVYDITGE